MTAPSTGPRLAIISNHLSTQNKADGAWLLDIIAGHAWVRHYVIDQIADIPVILRDCATAGIETLAIDGGDGTAGLVFSGLLNDGPYTTLPALALLPSGKTNMTAAAWSLTGDRREALAALLVHCGEGTLPRTQHTQAILTLYHGSAPPKHGAFFGGADVVDGILYCRRKIYPLGWPNTLSHSAAVCLLLWRALKSGPQGGTVRVTTEDGGWSEDGRFFVVMATTMDKMLLGMRAHPSGGAGPMNYISLRPGAIPVLSTFAGLLRRRFKATKHRTVRRTESVSFSFDGTYTLDGEIYETNTDTPIRLDSSQTLTFVRW
ncbi:MAG: diacylglycerol kinase family protein [Rhodospirillaceae bacterium]